MLPYINDFFANQEGRHIANDGQEHGAPGQGHGHLGHLGAHEGHHVAADGQANMFCRNLPLGQASFVCHTLKHFNTICILAQFNVALNCWPV